MGRLEPLFSVGGNIKWYSQYGSSLKKIKIELPYDSVSKFYTSAKKKRVFGGSVFVSDKYKVPKNKSNKWCG